MSTPTEAQYRLAHQVRQYSTQESAAQLIADSEARATAELRGALALGQENCDAAYDELRADCDELRGDVVRLTAESDQLRAEAKRFQRLQNFIDTAAAEMKSGLITFGGIAELRAERDQLRSEVEHFKFLHQCESESSVAAFARAYRAEAELTNYKTALEIANSSADELCCRWRELRAEVERCNDIINRASVQFFHDGTDGETAAKMLKVLNEAKP
jgi:chromosome segregation ATPase